ncbi:MAG: cell division protein FtsZ [Elusimicrobia bacterium]|nr:cell division protein FtsZ [Elusimicrobiota bacterium]
MENIEIRFPNNNNEVIIPDAKIKIVGVGGAGTNAVTRMIMANITGVKLYAVNTDNGSLKKSAAENRVSIGTGLGVGGDPVKGKQYAEEAVDKFRDILQGANMVFITTGMGGGTGTGAAPVIARVSKELGILTVGVVTRPFTAEGPERVENAKLGIAEMREYTDALIVIPNDRIFTLVDSKTHYEKGFEVIDDVLRRSIESITDTITKTGTINIDFADVKGVLSDVDNAIIGLGDGQTLEEAFQNAITNKFVEGEDIVDAHKILINISYSNINEIAVGDVKYAYDYCAKEFRHYKSLKVGNIENNELDTKIRVAIIASFKKDSVQDTDKEEEDQLGLFKNKDTSEDISRNKKTEETKKEEDIFSKPAYETYKPTKL